MTYQTSEFQDQINDLKDRVDILEADKIRRDAETVRENAGPVELFAVLPARWLKPTSDGWVLVKRDDNPETLSLPSHLKVSLSSSAGGRDSIVVAEGIYTGLKASLTSGFLVDADPTHSAVSCTFSAGDPITIGGQVYDKRIVLTFTASGSAQKVGPHPAKTHPTNPVPMGTHVVQIPDFPHSANPDYGPLRTVWFRIGTSGDRYVHPGRVSLGCITCAPVNWEEIYTALSKGRKDQASVGELKVS